MTDNKLSQKFYENNFNYIRLFLAIEVLIHHLDSSFIEKYLFFHKYFPGVPGFFFVSGFLIFASFDRLRNIRKFYLNRFLRIYPALVIISLLGFLYVSYINYYHFNNNYFFENFTWFLSQITFFQYYRHNYLEYSVNWVTWTITIELIFYIITPAFFYFKSKEKLLILLIILSFILFSFSINNSFHPLIYNSPLIWGWMLFMGSLFYLYFEKIYKYKKFFIFVSSIFLNHLFSKRYIKLF